MPKLAGARFGHALASNHDAKPGSSARLAQALLLSAKKKLVRFKRISTKNGRRVCAGNGKHVLDLDPTVARTCPHEDGASRTADAPGEPTVGENAPEEIQDQISFLLRGVALKWLRGLENSINCGDTRRRFRRRGLARARAATHERIRGAGRYGRGVRALQRRNRARRLAQAGENCK